MSMNLAQMYLPNMQKIAINNAWKIRKDFNFLAYPGDFSKERLPTSQADFSGELLTNTEYMIAMDKAGGILYAGATMAFATGYWAVCNISANLIGYYGCDMIYPKDSPTHFYGTGTPDPLRKDISLGSLEGCSARLFAWGLMHGKLLANFSESPQSRLVFPKVSIKKYERLIPNKNLNLSQIWFAFIEEAKAIYEKERNAKFNYLDHDYTNIAKNTQDEVFISDIDCLWEKTVPLIEAGWTKYIALC